MYDATLTFNFSSFLTQYFVCLADGGGIEVTGTSLWYVDHAQQVCLQDCTSGGDKATCGGLASSSDQLYDIAKSCCQAQLGYINDDLCEANSLQQEFDGTMEFYPFYQENKCVQNCEEASDLCGGIIQDSSTPMFETIEECCSEKLSHINPDICQELSDPGTGTEKFYSVTSKSRCYKDCELGVGCARINSTSIVLHEDLESCCDAMPWVSSEFCASRSTEEASDLWYASTQNQVCVNDCLVGDGCVPLEDPTAALYATALECCQAKIPSVSSDICADVSEGNPLVGSKLYYVSYTDERCVMDCAPADDVCGGLADSSDELFANATACCEAKLRYKSLLYCETISDGGDYAGSGWYFADYPNSRCLSDCDESIPWCGGIVEESSVEMNETIAGCCDTFFPSIDSDLCAEASGKLCFASIHFTYYASITRLIYSSSRHQPDPTSTGTGKYYGVVADSVCVADDEITGARVEDLSTKLYDTIEECCAAALPWVTSYYCESRSNEDYSNLWYVQYPTLCVKDCESGPGCVPLQDSSVKLYDTSLNCCEEKLNWLDSASCDARSNGLELFSDLFYVDYKNNVCKQDCSETDPLPCGGNPSESNSPLYDTLEECCETKLQWNNLDECVASSNGQDTTTAAGSNEYYVNWKLFKCAKDCIGSAPCGGLKNSWDASYSNPSDCCANHLSWIDEAECVLS